MTSGIGLVNIQGTPEYELEWLQKWPDFEERPATLPEFLGPKYLNLEQYVRPRIREELANIFGDEVSGDRMTAYQLAMVTGGIGIGKTTIASIVLPWLVHYCLCLKNPQEHFGLMPGSRIAFMQMSTSEDQAREVIFADVKARIEHSPWFQRGHTQDPKHKNQIRWPEKDLWIIPGDSKETTFEGYNIMGGVLDEADSHLVTKNKDYAEQGYTTIHTRMTSRFDNDGFLIIIGQMKQANGFAARKFKEFSADPNAYASRLAIWESRGDEYYAKKSPDGICHKFIYDTQAKKIVPPAAMLVEAAPNRFIHIPEVYRRDFSNNPEKALRDLAGIPPAVNDPFISLVDRIVSCRERWVKRFNLPSPFNAQRPKGRELETWFTAPNRLPRAVHVDIAYAEDGDAMTVVMGHVQETVDIDGEEKPYIVIDLMARWVAPAGGELFLGDMRRFLYDLKGKRNFRIRDVTLDGFQSQDTIQQLRRRKFRVDYLSVDRQKLPYEDLREAIYEERLEFPPLMVKFRYLDDEPVEIAVKELSELQDLGNKIDHPEGGSKDVADGLAGVVYTLMGTRSYARKAGHREVGGLGAQGNSLNPGLKHPAYLGDAGLRAPEAPTIGAYGRT